MNPDGSAPNPEAYGRQIRSDSYLLAQMSENDPELAQAIVGDDTDLDRLQELLQDRRRLRFEYPFGFGHVVEADDQKKNVGETHMPYVDMEVNGVAVKALVATGAQATVISRSCAERCGLLPLLDRRYRGVARVVGQSEILGRVHVSPIKLGSVFYPCSFMVVDSPDVGFVFGLDMLRQHRCVIDFGENVLRVGGGGVVSVSIPFLQEKDHVQTRDIGHGAFFG